MPWLWTMWMGCSPVAPEYVEQVPIVLEAGRTRTLAVDAVLELPGFARCDGWSFTVYLREIEDGSLAGVTSSHEGFEQDLSDIGFFVFLDDPDIEDDFTLDELDRCVARSAFAFTATDPVDTVLDLEVLAIGASTRTDLATVTAEIGWLD